MTRLTQLYTLTFTLILTGDLLGCAAYKTCGFSACAGDASLSATVRALIDQQPVLAPILIDIQTLDHVVYL